MRTKRVLAGFLATTLVAILVAFSCAPKPSAPMPAAPVREVVVGSISGLTGPTMVTHTWCNEGSKDYFRYVNAKGGIEGKKGKVIIKYIPYDSQYVATKAKDGFALLKGQGMVIHTQCASGHSDALISDYEAAKIPLVTGSLGVASAWSDWCYNTYHSGASNIGGSWMMWAKSEWEKAGKPGGSLTLGMTLSDEPWRGLYLAFMDDFVKELGVKLVTEDLTRGATDATPQLLRLKQAGCWQILVAASVSPYGVVVYKSAKTMNLGIPLTQHLVNMPGEVLELAGKELAEGIQCQTAIEPMTQKGSTGPGMDLARKLFAEYHPGAPIMDLYANGMISAMVIEKAISLALDEVPPEQLTGEAIKIHGLDQIRDFNAGGLCRSFSYLPGDHIGPKSMKYWVIRGGELLPISDWLPAATKRAPKP